MKKLMNSVGTILTDSLDGFVAAHGDEDLESLVARQVGHDPGVMRIVFDDEENAIVG